ncbi:MAG: divalent-cation tolerance protein CutA [Gammaproteobacteria bacterium]
MEENQLVVFCTCPDRESGERLGGALVQERLAACVNVVPGLTSIYRWEGALKMEPECLLIIKAMASRFADLRQRLRELHPYELPEIIALPICDGDPEYLKWLTANARPA